MAKPKRGTGVPPVDKGSVGVPPVLLVSRPVNPVQPRQITQVVAQLGQDHLTIKKRQGAYLPHWERTGATYSVAFRLADSLPRAGLEQFLFEREDIVKTARQMNRPLSAQEQKRLALLYSEKVESYLDAGHGACWLRQDKVAKMVADALGHFDGERYRLAVWCIMPNHVHVVVEPIGGHKLSDILHSWKSFTAKTANKMLHRTGEFWQAESYDHLIRNQVDFNHAVEYVLCNPAKAGLSDWKWVGCSSPGTVGRAEGASRPW